MGKWGWYRGWPWKEIAMDLLFWAAILMPIGYVLYWAVMKVWRGV